MTKWCLISLTTTFSLFYRIGTCLYLLVFLDYHFNVP